MSFFIYCDINEYWIFFIIGQRQIYKIDLVRITVKTSPNELVRFRLAFTGVSLELNEGDFQHFLNKKTYVKNMHTDYKEATRSRIL